MEYAYLYKNSGSAITGGNGSFGYSDFNSNVVSKDSEKIIDNSSFKVYLFMDLMLILKQVNIKVL